MSAITLVKAEAIFPEGNLMGVGRLNKFQKNILGTQGVKAKVKDIDLRSYVKYLLKEGAPIEKRGFLSCMESKFTIARKVVAIEK